MYKTSIYIYTVYINYIYMYTHPHHHKSYIHHYTSLSRRHVGLPRPGAGLSDPGRSADPHQGPGRIRDWNGLWVFLHPFFCLVGVASGRFLYVLMRQQALQMVLWNHMALWMFGHGGWYMMIPSSLFQCDVEVPYIFRQSRIRPDSAVFNRKMEDSTELWMQSKTRSGITTPMS